MLDRMHFALAGVLCLALGVVRAAPQSTNLLKGQPVIIADTDPGIALQPTQLVYDYSTSTGSGLILDPPRPTLVGDAGRMDGTVLPPLLPSQMYEIDSVQVARVHGT